MSGPRTIRDLLEMWLPGLSLDEARALDSVHRTIHLALFQARDLPSTLDGRARALIVTKLEEAGHWATDCTMHAVNRKERES